MADQPSVHRYSHLPGGNDQLDWLGSIHAIGVASELPPANSGQFPSGYDGTVTSGGHGLTSASANFISDMVGMSLHIFDTSSPTVTVEHFCTVTAVTSATVLTFNETSYRATNTNSPATASGPTYSGASQTGSAGWSLEVGNIGQSGSDGVTTLNSNVFTSASANFTSSWIGCSFSANDGTNTWHDFSNRHNEPRIIGVVNPNTILLSSNWAFASATGCGWLTDEWYWQANAGTLFHQTDKRRTFESDGAAWHQLGASAIRNLLVIIDGSGQTIVAGIAGDKILDFDCTVVGWTLLADQTGSIQVDVWKVPYSSFPPTVANSITGSAPPKITSAVKNQSTSLTGWTTTISAGDALRFNVDSITSMTRVTLSIQVYG